ncbi:FmdB family zinc ribbon protein [Pseudonocardia sichuanensis]
MVTYQYRCPACGDVDVRRPMGEASTQLSCPRCGAGARRVFTGPHTRLVAPGLVAALDTAGASAENPQVVTSVPTAAGPPRRPAHPLHARLPRP